MIETNIRQTNSENDKATQKNISLPIITEQILPKRIRKRIKYYRKAVTEKTENCCIENDSNTHSEHTQLLYVATENK